MADPGTPALQISRRFYAAGRRLVLAAFNTMPADRFFYSVEIQRDGRMIAPTERPHSNRTDHP